MPMKNDNLSGLCSNIFFPLILIVLLIIILFFGITKSVNLFFQVDIIQLRLVYLNFATWYILKNIEKVSTIYQFNLWF